MNDSKRNRNLGLIEPKSSKRIGPEGPIRVCKNNQLIEPESSNYELRSKTKTEGANIPKTNMPTDEERTFSFNIREEAKIANRSTPHRRIQTPERNSSTEGN